MDTMLRVDEAARILNCHKNTVYSLIRKGRLPASRVQAGTHDDRYTYRISIDDLLTYIDVTKLPAVAQQARLLYHKPGDEQRL